jgi:hypothetical protein
MKNFSYKIQDTPKGIFANVELSEGTFNLEIKQLPYNKIDGNRRVFEVVGNYPKENYSISYEAGKLFILEITNKDYSEGQKVTHKVFGKGVISKVTETALQIEFKAGSKTLLKSMASNFLS